MFTSQLFQFILGLAVLIVLHEFGHFIVARLFKVEVEEFGLGFPPRAAKLFEAGGTEFTLNWIPLGGFVRPKGENDPDVPGGLAAASPWVRLAVTFAGPITNILVGIILGVLLFYTLGDPIVDQVLIQQVADGSPAQMAGLQTGDRILAVDGQAVDSSEKLQNLIEANLDQEISLTYERGSQERTVSLVPRSEPPAGQGAMGIIMTNPTRPIGFGTAVSRGAQAAYEYGKNVLLLPVRMIRGELTAEESRPIGFKGMFDAYQYIQNNLYFFMVISLSLGIFNLFPIPALDGGRILLTLPEILLRRRIPPRYENMIHLVGFALLLILMIYINVQDFINPIQLPK